ncbi:MAG: EpsG family protein [Cetobacterium sp.]
MIKTLLLCVVLVFFSVLYCFSKKAFFKKILDLMGIILIIFFYSNNRWNNDYEAYSGSYFSSPELYAEKGYVILVELVKIINGNFNYILFLVSIFIIYTMYTSLKKSNLFLMCIFYFIYPFILDLNQIRNTIMIFCIVNSLRLFNDKRKVLSYMFFIVAITFQKLGFIYIPFILFLKNKTIKFMYVFSILCYFLSFLVCSKLEEILILLTRYGLLKGITMKLNIYTRSFSFSTLILWTTIFLFDIFFIKKLRGQKKEENLEIYYKFLLYAGSLIPLFCVVAELNRIYRNIFFLKYIILLSLISDKKNITKICIVLITTVTSLFLLFLLYLRGLEIDKTLFSFF